MNLKPDWHTNIPKHTRIYPLGFHERKVISDTLHDLHSANKISRTRHEIPFIFPMFIAWQTLPNGTRKDRMIIDVRGLNRIILPDAYPMQTQDNILANINNKKFIITMDASAF